MEQGMGLSEANRHALYSTATIPADNSMMHLHHLGFIDSVSSGANSRKPINEAIRLVIGVGKNENLVETNPAYGAITALR